MANRALALLIASTILLQVLAISGSDQNLDVSNSSNSQAEEGNITLENGRPEVLTISFDVDSTTDLHELEITIFDVAGNSQNFIFDAIGAHSTTDSIVIPAWAAGNHSEAIEMFRTRIDSHPFFEASWQGESVLQIVSLIEGDLEEWVLNPSEGVATLSAIDGENPRVHPTIEEVLSIPVTEGWDTYDGIRPTSGFQLSDEGSMIIAGSISGWSNDESLLDCNIVSKTGREHDGVSWGYFMVKFDSEGECVWLHQTQLYRINEFWTIGESVIFKAWADSSLSILGQDIENGAGFMAGINPSGTYDFVMASPYPQEEYDSSSQYEIQNTDSYSHIGSSIFINNNDGLIGFLESSPQDATAVFSDCPPIHPGSLFKIRVDGSCEFVKEGALPDSDGDGTYDHQWSYSFALPDGKLVMFEGFYGGGTGLDWTPKIHVFNGSNGELIRSLSDLRNESRAQSPMVTGSFPQHQFGFKPSTWQQVETPYTQCIGDNWHGTFERPLGISNSSILFRFTYKTSDSSPSECRPGIAIMNISNGDFTLFDEEQLGMHVSPQNSWTNEHGDSPFTSEVYPNGDGFCMVPERTELWYNNESPVLDEGFFRYAWTGWLNVGVRSVDGSCFNDKGEFSFAYSETMSEIPGFPEYSAWGQENRYYRSHDETLYILKKELRYNNSHQEQEFFLTILRVTPPEEVDFDGDSVLDLVDLCLGTEYQAIVDGEGCSWDQRDDDGDGWLNPIEDDCQTDPNDSLSYPLDADGDLECDLKDDDDDDDGVLDEMDQFPLDAEESRDFDGDGIGDNSDPDDDGDGWEDETEISCYTDHLDSSSYPIDEDGDGQCDSPFIDSNNDGSPDEIDIRCDFMEVDIYRSGDGCPLVFDPQQAENMDKVVASVNSVEIGSNGIDKMLISDDGGLLAVLDDKSLLMLYFLDDGSREDRIILEGEKVIKHQRNGRISIVGDGYCTDVIIDLGCDPGWESWGQTNGSSHYWSGEVYFTDDYTACEPGFTGWSHCKSGWFRVGDWNEFNAPSITGLVHEAGSGVIPCEGCASPDGRYIADTVEIILDWELLGYADSRRDVIVSKTETWVSADSASGASKPGGVATLIGGYEVGSCGSVACLLSELGEDGIMYDFGGFAWSGDSSHLYVATSDHIATIDPEEGEYWEVNNPYTCDGKVSHFTGTGTPDGSRVVVPCGEILLILDIEEESDSEGDGGPGGFFHWCCGILVWLIALCSIAILWSEIEVWSLFVGLIVISSGSWAMGLFGMGLVGWDDDMWETGGISKSGLDIDPNNLPEIIEISIQGGLEDGSLVVYVSSDTDVPSETIDVLVEGTDSLDWFRMGFKNTGGSADGYDLHDRTSFNTDPLCSETCSSVSVKAFYRGEMISQELIQ